MSSHLDGSRVVVTGVCGSIGSALAKKLLSEHGVRELIGLDHNENELAFLQEDLAAYGHSSLFLGDIRDASMLLRRTRGADVIFHTAACKHVHMCEHSPMEAMQTNVIGTQNVIEAAHANNIPYLIFTSTDKAVNPTNVMGTSKLLAERLVTAAALLSDSEATLVSTRFGNVLGSRGSVIPIFKRQIKAGGPVTLTDPDMTRFIMSMESAIELVIKSAGIARPGDAIITKMPAIRIPDLAEILIRECAPSHGYRPQDIVVKVTGAKPGEKLFEELMNEEETRRAIELKEYFVVRPALVRTTESLVDYPDLVRKNVEKPYNSSNCDIMSQDDLFEYLKVCNLISNE